jgi:hypothetical protein
VEASKRNMVGTQRQLSVHLSSLDGPDWMPGVLDKIAFEAVCAIILRTLNGCCFGGDGAGLGRERAVP